MFFRKSQDHTELSDLDLIHKYKDSENLETLGLLYDRYIHLVYGVCLKYLRSREDSQDAVMQIFEKLIEDLKRFEVRNFKSWLHVTARNYCLMALRKKKTSGISEFSLISDMEYQLAAHHEDETPIEEDLDSMKNCMKNLPDEQKTCINLFYLEQKSYNQVAELSGFDLNKVKSYIQNGKRNIKICMERQNE